MMYVCIHADTVTALTSWKNKTNGTLLREFNPKCELLLKESTHRLSVCVCVCNRKMQLFDRDQCPHSTSALPTNTVMHTPNTVMKIQLQSHPALTK